MIIAVSNEKGGVGKTTTALNLAAALLRSGATVQLWDLDDKQANLSGYAARCGIPCRQTRGVDLKNDLASIQADYHILDCSPRAESTVVFAYQIADWVLVPVQCEQFAIDGVVDLMATLKPIEAKENPNLKVRILITMYASPFKEERDELRSIEDIVVLKSVIPRFAGFAKAQRQGVSIFDYEGGGRGARAFTALSKEVISCS